MRKAEKICKLLPSEHRANIREVFGGVYGLVVGTKTTLAEKADMFSEAMILLSLEDCRWNQVHAAKKLGCHRNTLSRYLDAAIERRVG